MCAISGEATQEAALEGMLRKVQDKWTGVELTVKQYKEAKDAYILGSVEDVQAVLEDSLALMATISSSRFVAGICQHTEICCQPSILVADSFLLPWGRSMRGKTWQVHSWDHTLLA